VKRLDEDGEVAAAELYGRLGGLADSAQTLSTILYSKAEKDRPGLAGAYNALVASWPSIQRLARQSPPPSEPEQQTLDEM
jgi:putative DNA methylase